MPRSVWLLVAFQLTLWLSFHSTAFCGGLEDCFDKCDRMEKQAGTRETDIVDCYDRCYRGQQDESAGKSTPANDYDKCLMQCGAIDVSNDLSKRLYEECCRKCAANAHRPEKSRRKSGGSVTEGASGRVKSRQTGEDSADSSDRADGSVSEQDRQDSDSKDSERQDRPRDCVKLMTRLHNVTVGRKPGLEEVLAMPHKNCDRQEDDGVSGTINYARCFPCTVEGIPEVYYGQLMRTVLKVRGKVVSDTHWYPNSGCDCR